MTAGHVPGTIYPRDGQRPHAPTLCAHRSSVRRGFRSQTVLCYEHGAFDLVRQDGTAIECQTADGLVPFRFCVRHVDRAVSSYRGQVTPRPVRA